MTQIKPFTRIVWRSDKAKTQWNDRINNINDVYRKCEVETVIRGIRRATTHHMGINDVNNTFMFLKENNLIFTPIAQAGYSHGFTHNHTPVEAGKPSYWYGSITRTDEDGELFKLASNSNKQTDIHTPIGELLGYPKCCTEKFILEWTNKNYDPMFEIAKATDGVEVLNTEYTEECIVSNINTAILPLLRYFGIRTIPHFPCKFCCKESEKVSEKWLKVMEDISVDAVNDTKELLESITSWDSLNGVVEIDTPYFRGITHTFPYFGKNRIIKTIGN